MLCFALVMAVSAGCGVRKDSPQTQQDMEDGGGPLGEGATQFPSEEPLTVVVPHVLKKSFTQISKQFMNRYSDVDVEIVSEVIDALPGKVANGELKGDILAIMGGPELAPIGRSGLVDLDEKTHFVNIGVIVAAPRGNPLKVKSLEGLTKDQVKTIAVPDPQCDSTGKAFIDALKAEGLYDQVEPKLDIRTCPHTACVEVENDNADLGITYAPCVLFGHSDMTLCIASHLPVASAGPVEFIAAPFAQSTHPAAGAFTDHLLSQRAQSVFAKLGMEPVADPAESAEVESLLVLAGAGLQPAMDAVADAYREKTGVRVDFSYAGSGMLLSQLHFSRRGDGYIPGESWWVDKAAGRDLVAKRAQVAYFAPVICVQKGNPKGIESVADLGGQDISVAIGDPEALAVGPVTQRIIERAGVKEGVMKNVALQAGCIPELANAVAMKTVDGTIVWDATARQLGDKVDIVPIDAEYNEVAEVVFATLTTSKHPQAAADLMEFVASDEAAEIIEEQGFTTTRPEGVRLSPDREQGN